MKTMYAMVKGLLGGVGISLMACQDLTSKLPAGSVDPNTYTTPEAAMEMARGARYNFQLYLLNAIIDGGQISDELSLSDLGRNQTLVYGVFDEGIVLDQRHLPDETLLNTPVGVEISKVKSYTGLQRIRSTASLARRALQAYAPDAPVALQGEMFAYEAMAEILLADLYCSGVPLSTVDFQNDYTHVLGSTTTQIYEHALTLLDSAIVLALHDNSVRYLARVGKGRALLALGRYADADTAVREVTQDFAFQLPIMHAGAKTVSNPTGNQWEGLFRLNRRAVANGKGENGISFVDSNDPRVKIAIRNSSPSDTVWWPVIRTNLVVASYIEARLIHAEAVFNEDRSGEQYLDVLNALRTDGTFTVGIQGDTIYNPGTGKVAGLAPLSSTDGITGLDLIMRERAFWLYLTGHRQGDLRRMIRNYDRRVEEVYPIGVHPAGIGYFDQYIDIPVPSSEGYNPYYSGCISRGA